MKLIDESETDVEEDTHTVINNVHDYHSVFKPNRTCKYTNLFSYQFIITYNKLIIT